MSLEKSQAELGSYVSDRITTHAEQSLKSYQNGTISHLGKVLEMSQHAIISHMDRRLEGLEAKMTPPSKAGRPEGNSVSLSLQQIQFQVSLGQKNVEQADDDPPPYSERLEYAGWTPPIHSLAPYRRANICDSTCQCRCHSPSTYSWTMTSMRPILGDIGLSYRGHSARCTSKACRYFGQNHRPSRRVHIMYCFPNWLARATLYVMYSSNHLNGNPEMVIRVMNRLPLGQFQANSIFGRARAGDTEGVKKLLREGSVCINDVIGHTGTDVLTLSMVFGSPEMTKMLLQAGADPFREPEPGIGNAVSYAFQLMLGGKKIETARLFPIDRFVDEMEFPPLSRIVMGDLHINLAEALQTPEYAADINRMSLIGWTPLDIAVHKGDVAAMRLLIQAGADVDAVSGRRGSAALLRACINGNYEAAKVLLEAGASIHIQDRSGMGPLSNAAMSEADTPRLMSLLIRYGIDIGTPGGRSRSPPLVFAVIEGTIANVRYLLERGADANWRDSDGDTPIVDAIIRGHCDKVELLMEYGCDIETVNNEGQGLLHFVASHGTLEVMKLFREKRITRLNPGAKDKHGKTPMNFFNGRNPPPTTEYREAFDEMLDSLEQGFYGRGDDEKGDSDDEFFDARETLDC